jgi:Tol biopolymer transport system component
MSHTSSRFAVRAILTFCSAIALVVAAPGQRPAAMRDSPVAECSKHVDCDDGNVCTRDKCDKDTGTCEFRPIQQRSACDDGNACTSVDVCDSGVCQGSALADGTSCSDGSACTQRDICQTGACTGVDPIVCTAGDQCHVAGACDPATGACSTPAAPDGTACDDTETCSGQDACEVGVCTVPGVPVEKMVFSSTRHNPVPAVGQLPQVYLEIYMMSPDGTGLVRLTDNAVNDSFAALSPDGKGRIVFDSARGTPAGSPANLVDLYLMKSDGSHVQYLARGSSASWSPDSQSIAFHRSASGTGLPVNQLPGASALDSDIFVARLCDLLAGLPPTNITNSPGMIDTDASWSPDGQKILFTRFSAADNLQTPTSAEIWSIRPDGSGPTQLTFNAVEERAPSWSSDGTHISYVCKQGTVAPDADNEICVMNADGTGQTQLTFNTTNDATSSYSPDDQKVIFHSGQLFTMNPDGTGRIQITSSAGISQFADWGFARSR